MSSSSSSSSSAASTQGLLAGGASNAPREMSGLPAGGFVAPLRWFEKKRLLMANFCLMAVCFSINHGCVTALLSVASADLGKHLGSVSSGTLYLLYTLSALTVASALTQAAGAKRALTIGLGMYCAYVASFWVAKTQPHVKWYAAVTGSTIGGLAAGWLWTAQGSFFSRTAQLYARASGLTLLESTGALGGVFATLYVGFEVGMKSLLSLLRHFASDTMVFAIFFIVAATAAALMVIVKALPTETEEWIVKVERDNKCVESADGLREARGREQSRLVARWNTKVVLAARLLMTDRKIQLLAPLNIAFGFVAGLMNQFVNGTPAKHAVGDDNIAFLAAITPAVATLLSLPYAYLARNGKGPLMVWGAVNYTAMALFVVFMSEDGLENLGWWISLLYVVGGSGRAVFESTNKAVFADAWPNDKEAAFANVIVMSGGASTVAFFAIPYLSKNVVGAVTAGTGLLAIVCLYFFFRDVKKQQRQYAALPEEGGAVSA